MAEHTNLPKEVCEIVELSSEQARAMREATFVGWTRKLKEAYELRARRLRLLRYKLEASLAASGGHLEHSGGD